MASDSVDMASSMPTDMSANWERASRSFSMELSMVSQKLENSPSAWTVRRMLCCTAPQSRLTLSSAAAILSTSVDAVAAAASKLSLSR